MKKTRKFNSINEGFRANSKGDLKREGEYDGRSKLDEFDQKTIDAVEESGIYGKLILASFDYVINKAIELINKLFVVIFKEGYNMFKTDEEMEVEKIRVRERRRDILKNGSVVIRYSYFRYLITLLVPPLGIFMSKGIYGWVNILISFLLMYLYYPIAIFYGLIITINSYYADLYETVSIKEVLKYGKKE